MVRTLCLAAARLLFAESVESQGTLGPLLCIYCTTVLVILNLLLGKIQIVTREATDCIHTVQNYDHQPTLDVC